MGRSRPPPHRFAVGRKHLVTATVVENRVSAFGIVGKVGTRDQKIAGFRPDRHSVSVFSPEKRPSHTRPDPQDLAALPFIDDRYGEIPLALGFKPFRGLFEHPHGLFHGGSCDKRRVEKDARQFVGGLGGGNRLAEIGISGGDRGGGVIGRVPIDGGSGGD